MKKLFLFLVVFFSFLSLSAGWGEDLCEDVTCSGHGSCQEDGEDEWCVCDEGYIADGLECILGCNGVTCSGHGVCSVVSGAEVCTCEAGFYASGLNCILNEASTVDTLAILNETGCYNTGNCHYRLIFATGAYSFTPSIASLYDIIVNVLDSENVWHNYRKTVAQCVSEGVCDNVDAQYVDFWFQHEVNGNQYITVEVLGNGDDASDDMYHDVLIDYCYGVDCGTGGSCDDSSGYSVCTCDYGYVLRNGYCEEGWFEDENLAAAVVELLKYKGFAVETESDIEPEMLSGIEYLPLNRRNISSLAGIGLFSSLSVLDISGNNISDLSPLSDCSGLAVLNMSGNPARDLSPLGSLPLVSLDISYSGVYNMNPLVSIGTLSELVFADTEEGRHSVIRPDGLSVSVWLGNLNLLECNEFFIYDTAGNSYKTGVIGIGSGCPSNGSCVNGICLCNTGHSYSAESNTCFNLPDCGEGNHYNTGSGVCERNQRLVSCSEDDRSNKVFPFSRLEWNGSVYAMPSGYTNLNLCRINDESCDIAGGLSLCRWRCRQGFSPVEGGFCVPETAKRTIPDRAYNQKLMPDISRQDVMPEPVPGIPSFAPVLRAGMHYNSNKIVSGGWYLDLPRVEFQTYSELLIYPVDSWDQQTVYVHMPWGKEEYSLVADKKCFDQADMPVQCETSSDLSDADHVEITYYPAPGQNLFSYIVLETTGEACKISRGGSDNTDGKYFYGAGSGRDTWKITRYGDDGSVTEFYRGEFTKNISGHTYQDYASRPALYRFMDYVPVSKHTTRDKKVTRFKYEWQKVTTYDGDFSHYIIRSVNITDPLKRGIKIESEPENGSGGNGLTGDPEFSYARLYRPVKDSVTIYTGRVNAADNIVDPVKVAEYTFGTNFEMTAGIYRDGNLYRTDYYLNGMPYENKLKLESKDVSGGLKGKTVWNFVTDSNTNKPAGYTETRLIENSTPSETLVRSVTGKFHLNTEPSVKDYSLFLVNDNNKITTVYLQETGRKRIVEDYFTNWLQPAKRVTCEREGNQTESCSGMANAVTEEIRYNVSGSPIYFKNADGQVTVSLYNSEAYQFDTHLIEPDDLRRYGTLACSAVYSLDAEGGEADDMLGDYAAYGIDYDPDWCLNASDRRVTNYEWTKQAAGKPYDLKTVTCPDGMEKTFTYDYETTTPSGYTDNGKIWGETTTGSSNQNTLQTCYEYNENYQLEKQGIGTPGSCDYKKGFAFGGEGGLLMTQDYSFDENMRSALENDYIYDKMGRKLVERNSAGVSTVYVYDSLDRVVFTFFGCDVDTTSFGTVYNPHNFDGSASDGETGTGVDFSFHNGEFPYARYISLDFCQYYRKYKYDEMSNLVETYFFEYWGVSANNQVEPLTAPKIIKQTTEYDLVGRAIKSCQFDVAQPSNKRCIETEHDAFGNIVKKEEAVYDQNNQKRNDVHGETREITYDHRNRPITVTVDGLPTEEYSYSNSSSGGYFGYDEITNKYGKTLITYKDKWGRAAKSVDPFGNNVEPHYNSTTWLTDYSKTYNGTTLTGFDAYEYDDLGRVSTIKKVLFDPASNTSNATATSISGIAAKEMVLEKSVSYDPVTGSVVAVEDSFGNETVKVYDSLNRVIKVENYDADNQLVSSVRTAYDVTGRISAEQSWTSAKTTVTEYDYDKMGRVTATCVSAANVPETQDCLASSCTFTDTKCSYQLYNTGGQVVWSADTEAGETTTLLPNIDFDSIIGNETVYDYNAFGEAVKTARRMTANGLGGGLTETQLYNSDGWITTNYTYDIFGRNTEKADDNGAKTYYTYTANNLPATEKYCGSDDSNCASPREVTYTYNNKRDLVSETYEQNGDTLTVNYGRDDYGRISQKYTGSTANDVYQTFTYNNRNLLETAKSVDPTNTTSTLSEVTRTYDSFGSIKSETFDSGTVSSAISWNSSTKVMTETTTLPTGKNIVETAFSGLPKALEYDGTKLLQYNYATGNVLSSIRKNFDSQDNYSAELSYTYNNWRKVSHRTEEFTAQNAPTVADYEYTYSKGLHLIGKQENEENRRTAYQYDSYYRLRRVDYDCDYSSNDPTCIENRNNVFKCNTAESGCEDFQLDGVHNIRSSYENLTNFAWTVDGFNRLTEKSDGSNTVKYSYDSNNNMIGEDFDGNPNTPPEIVYTYDKLNRLTSVTNSDYLVEYSYDPFNRRTEKTVYYADGNDTYEQTHKYAYNDWDIISEEIKTVRTSDNPASTTAWQLRRYVDQGTDNHIIMDTVSCSDDGNGNCSPNESTLQRIWFHKDERGNVIAVSDGNGTIYERYRYRVYGEHEVLNADFTPKTTAAISPFLWGGSLYEPETNLYWMRNRYYHTDMHRFINQDPIGIWGDANNLGNGFAYVAGMVIEASDPTGLASDANSFAEVHGFNKHDVPTTPMSPEEEMVVGWMGSAIFNIGLGALFGNTFGLVSGIFDTALTIISDLENTDSNFKFVISLTLLRTGEYYSIIKTFKWATESTSYKKLVGGFVKDAISLGIDFYSLYENSAAKDNELNENLDSDKFKTLLLDNGDIVIADENGKIVHCSGDCSKNPEGSYLDSDLLKTLWGIYPSDPYEDASDMIQNIIRLNILTKMLKLGESEQPPFFTDTSTGPNGAIMIYQNPYYVNKDPLKAIFFDGNDGSGRPMIYRNPHVPANAEYGYDSTTYEKWQQSGFPQTNVDPYWY